GRRTIPSVSPGPAPPHTATKSSVFRATTAGSPWEPSVVVLTRKAWGSATVPVTVVAYTPSSSSGPAPDQTTITVAPEAATAGSSCWPSVAEPFTSTWSGSVVSPV